MDEVTIPASEEERPEIRQLSPDEVFSLIERLPNPINIAVLPVAATGGAYFRVPQASLTSCPLGRKQKLHRAGFPSWGDFEPHQD
jgi:hypothetical protein